MDLEYGLCKGSGVSCDQDGSCSHCQTRPERFMTEMNDLGSAVLCIGNKNLP